MKIRHLLYVALVVGLSAALAPIYGPGLRAYAAAPATPATADDLDHNMKSVASAFALVEKNFADPVTSEKAFYQGAIPGMLHSLDPHSNFVDPDDYREMQRRQHAQYFGVGMEIVGDADGHVNVMRPFYGSPAYNAGFRRGDVIEAVDGKDVTKLNVAERDVSNAVANLLRGPRGTQVRVAIKREGAPDYITAQITRGEIETSVVDAFWVTPDVLYVRVDNFEASNLSHDVEADLRKLGEAKAKGLILDLRYNPGGLVNEAVALAGRWLRDGQVVVSHHGRAEEEQVFRAKSVSTAQKYPVVVLVNSQSASASEIVSGALQDHDRAWLIGETTFGKGLVQAQFPLSEGAALLLTIAHYYTPSGRLIQRDYSHESFYDYLYTSGKEAKNTDDIKSTDSGRKVFGGGGITPDEKYPTVAFTPFERRMNVAVPNGVYPGPIYRFANTYFGNKKPSLPDGWQPGNDVLEQFRTYLKDQKMTFADADFDASKDFLKRWIRWEFYFRAFDKETADRALWKDDPEVQKGIQSGMEWNGMEWNGMEWNGMEWNGMEWNGMEWNGIYIYIPKAQAAASTTRSSRTRRQGMNPVAPAILSPALLLLAAFLPLQAQPKPQYEIYAVRYATLPGFGVNGLIEGADASRKLDIAMMVLLIRGNGKNILFDSGFHRDKYIQQWHPVDFANPADAVARAGVKPDEITDVIISHMHWDHAGGMDLFPKAKIWLQKDELEYYAGTAWQSRRTHGGIDADDVQLAVKLNTEGRVGLVNGDAQEILPGITAYTGGKHTYASQFITVNTAAGTVVLASDNMYLYENLEKHAPIAQTLDRESNLHAQDRMKQLAADPRLIIPGHDPLVMTKFQQVAPGVVKIQ